MLLASRREWLIGATMVWPLGWQDTPNELSWALLLCHKQGHHYKGVQEWLTQHTVSFICLYLMRHTLNINSWPAGSMTSRRRKHMTSGATLGETRTFPHKRCTSLSMVLLQPQQLSPSSGGPNVNQNKSFSFGSFSTTDLTPRMCSEGDILRWTHTPVGTASSRKLKRTWYHLFLGCGFAKRWWHLVQWAPPRISNPHQTLRN